MMHPPRDPARMADRFRRAGSSEGSGALVRIVILGVVAGCLPLVLPRYITPAVQAIPAWLILLDALRRGRPWRAVGLMLLWSLAVSITVIEVSRWWPEAAARGILQGKEYQAEMLHWIRTGEGAEGDPSLFVPQHLRHYGLTLAASFATAGLAGLGFGAVLLNYMNFYVGTLVDLSAGPLTASLLGWPIWSVLRVIGFVTGAIAAAHLLYGRVLRRAPWNARTAWRMLAVSALFVAGDMVVKALLAPHWRLWLRSALGE